MLEIGGGQDPHPAANVIVDKFLDDNKHRMRGADFVATGRLMATMSDGTAREADEFHPEVVQADVCNLPFSDKTFDFCIAKDILEHVPDIEKACSEISRVAKAGMVDVPRLTSEYLWPMAEGVHIWCFEEGPHGLVAYKKEFVSPFGNVMHELFAASPAMREAWSRSRHYFHLVGFWQGKLAVSIGAPVTAEWLNGTREIQDIMGVGL